MSSSAITGGEASGFPHFIQTRTTGIIYLLYFLAAICSKLLSDNGFTGIGSAVYLASTLLYISVTLLLYRLLRPVSPGLALVAVFASLLGCANDLLRQFQWAPFQINSLAFYWAFDLLLGLLILRSTFVPRFMGVVLVLAGIGLLVFVAVPGGSALVAPVYGLAFIAEVELMVWLLVRGTGDSSRDGG